MLQYIAKDNDNYSIPEQVQMALEGGCKWVQLYVPEKEDSEIREIAREIIPLCKEGEAMLTIVDHVELAKELSIHGTLLIQSDMSVVEAREFCGPEAIIGVGINAPEQLIPLDGVDLDYAALPMNAPAELLSVYIKAIRDAGIHTPLVAFGDYGLDEIEDLLATGVSGIALGASISDSPDPVETVRTILATIKK